MTAKREQFANNARNDLNGSVTNVQTTVTLTSAADFPSDGNYRILIDSEILLVTSVSGAVLTVDRGVEGTTAAAHDDGALVTQLVTDESLRQVIADDLLYANSKPLYHSLTDINGNVLTASSFTWNNQGTSTATDVQDTIYYTWPGDAANNLRSHELVAPSTPYTVTTGFRALLRNSDTGLDGFPAIMLGFRDNSTARCIEVSYHFRGGANGHEVIRMTNNTTYNSSDVNIFTATGAADMWMRIVDNGTNHEFKVSVDGVNWLTLLTQGRTAWTATPDRIFFGFDPAQTTTAGSACTLFHFSIANSAL
jgi:hypothetical protein